MPVQINDGDILTSFVFILGLHKPWFGVASIKRMQLNYISTQMPWHSTNIPKDNLRDLSFSYRARKQIQLEFSKESAGHDAGDCDVGL